MSLDKLLEIPSNFVLDLRMLVLSNRDVLIKTIRGDAERQLGRVSEDLAGEEEHVRRAETHYVRRHFDELEDAANYLALVGLVTRFDVWLVGLIHEFAVPALKLKVKEVSRVEGHLLRLQAKYGTGPYPPEYFGELTRVRDSIIHHNLAATWQARDSTPTTVAARYQTAYGKVSFTSEDFEEAARAVISVFTFFEDIAYAMDSPNMPRRD